MNTLIATGRLCENAELAYTQTGKSRLHFRIAVLDFSKNNDNSKTLFLDCYSFGKENILQYLTKGKAITIQGRLIAYEYIDKNNVLQRKIQVVVNEIEFMPTEKENLGATNSDSDKSGRITPPAQEQAKNQTISSNIPKTAGTYTKEGFTPASPDDFEEEEVPF